MFDQNRWSTWRESVDGFLLSINGAVQHDSTIFHGGIQCRELPSGQLETS